MQRAKKVASTGAVIRKMTFLYLYNNCGRKEALPHARK